MGPFRKNKKNWDLIKDKSYKETMKGRDVYEDQQLERSEIEPMRTMFSRNVMNGIICLLVFTIIWLFISGLDYLFSGGGKLEASIAPQAQWFHVAEHYVDPENPDDRLMVSEYAELVEAYKDHASVPKVEDPGPEPEHRDLKSEWKKSGLTSYTNDEGESISLSEYKAMVDGYEASYKQELEEWTEAKALYDAYVATQTDPAKKYMKQKEHYRNREDTEKYILPDEYQKLVDKYEAKVQRNKVSKDAMDVPVLPMDPADLYEPSVVEKVDGVKTPLEYRNKYDGTRLTAEEYEAVRSEYKSDLEQYKSAYMRHRTEFHPDDVNGTKKVFNLGPTVPKFFFSLVIASIVFAVLYAILKKNLAAMNVESRTEDINQYHNDQHVALIEEVQRNYDWFPDVGAHSAVSVSSLISHMALSNKGLKTVDMAVRAEHDIKDGDEVEYYEGEMLLDDEGNPITRKLPMVDEEFMEDLFEASGAARDKTIRRRFDTTKIPYNPDGKNRDKLGKYATVAELINDDWEIPLYEPQRPAGAYIVDTAPVNTMILAITRAGKGQTIIE